MRGGAENTTNVEAAWTRRQETGGGVLVKREDSKGRADLCADGMKMRKEMEIVEAETVRQ